MEPRPHERGKIIQHSGIGSFRVKLQWSHVLTNVERSSDLVSLLFPQDGFNGATSSRTWKGVRYDLRGPYCARLQWSHVLTNVERVGVAELDELGDTASMEPRPHERGKSEKPFFVSALFQLQWSHVLTNVERWGRVRAVSLFACFNGATSSRTWKGLSLSGGRVWSPTPLQWSHVLTNVERRRVAGNGHAAKKASMEPRPHERGKSPIFCRSSRRKSLQWSHVLTNVESRPSN